MPAFSKLAGHIQSNELLDRINVLCVSQLSFTVSMCMRIYE